MEGIKNQYVDQDFDKTFNWVYAKFQKYVPYNDFLPILERSYELTRFYKARKHLINLKQLSVHDTQVSEYINNIWFPTVKKLGVTHIAFILPGTATGKMSTKNAHKNAENIAGMLVNNFDDEIEARKWLKSMN
jgi:hypothetical protein